MSDAFSRTELVLGHEAMERLATARIAIFGIGGVGSYAAEGLARSGVGSFMLVDNDCVGISNLNRQIIALHSTIGTPKVEVMKARILDINPDADVRAFHEYYNAQSALRILGQAGPEECLGAGGISYIVDAIDSISSKIDLIMRAKAAGIPIISAMGTGNKVDPRRLELADIHETSVCPLARKVRTELKKRGVEALDVLYSREIPAKTTVSEYRHNGEIREPEAAEGLRGRRSVPGSVSFVPSVAGLLIASFIVRKIVGIL